MISQRSLAVMHVHTEWSHDGSDSLAAMSDFAVRERLRWVFLTDHAEDFDERRYRSYINACRDSSTQAHELVPGLEFRFAAFPGLHLLALGLRQWIAPQTPEEFCLAATDNAQFLVIAHPITTRYNVPDAVLAGVHALEIWNARYNTKYLPDGTAIQLWQDAQRKWPGILATCGTDQHNLLKEGRLRIELPSTDDPFASLRSGRFRNRGIALRVSAAPHWGQARHFLVSGLRQTIVRLKRWRNRRS